jgi:vacuolar-type H+-ATPase subunit H
MADSTVKDTAKDFDAAAGSKEAGKVASGLQTDASETYDEAAAFLGKGYEGPKAGDLTANLATTKDSLTGSLGNVDNAEVVDASLKDTYGKTGPYSKGFGLLDSLIVGGTKSGQDKLAEVKGKAKEVDSTFETTNTTLTQAEEDAKKKLDANKKQILDTAKDTKENIVDTASKEVETLNSTLANKVGGSAASLGDALDETERDDLAALAKLLEENVDLSTSFDPGKDKPAEDKPDPGDTTIPGTQTPGTVAIDFGDDVTDISQLDGYQGPTDKNPPQPGQTITLGEGDENPQNDDDRSGDNTFDPLHDINDDIQDWVKNPDFSGKTLADLAAKGIQAPAESGIGGLIDATKAGEKAGKEVVNKLGLNGGTPPNIQGPKPKAPPLKPPTNLPKVPDWAPKGVDPNMFDPKGNLVGSADKLVSGLNPSGLAKLLDDAPNAAAPALKEAISKVAAGMNIGDLNKLARALEKAGIGGSVAKTVGSLIAASKKGTDALKAAGKKAVEDAEAAAKEVANKAADEAKKLGGKVADEGKKAGNKVKNYVAPRLRR